MSKKISEAYLANPRATFDGTEQVPINDGTTNPAAGLVSRIAAYINGLLGTASTLAFDTDGTLGANSDTRIATQKAVKTFVAASGGTGTVTHTGGALTANSVVLGAGTADTKVVAGITSDGTSKLNLGVAGTSVGAVALANATSGTITVQPPTGALGTVTLTLPAATDTLVGKATTDTLTNKTLTSPTMTTPTLGVASATTVNKVTLTAPATGSTLTIVDGKTLTANKTLTLDGTDSTTMTFPEVSAEIGFRNIPQNSQSTGYTTLLTDKGKHLLHPSADTTARTFTIDSNANVAYPLGTAITFVNQHGAGTLTIAITSDTMRLAGAGTTGSRTLAADGIATAIKLVSTEWIISGTGLT